MIEYLELMSWFDVCSNEKSRTSVDTALYMLSEDLCLQSFNGRVIFFLCVFLADNLNLLRLELVGVE